MKISFEDLIGLKIENESGVFLGTLQNIVIDISSQSILEYHVRPSSLVKSITKDYLIITRGQIIEINNKKIIVRDLDQKKDDKKIINPKIKKRAVNLLSKNI
jgi:sporulation protein YlmC with PRC-barrel domain